MTDATKTTTPSKRYRHQHLRDIITFLQAPPLGGVKGLPCVSALELINYIESLEATVDELSLQLDAEHVVRRDLAGYFNGMTWDNRNNKKST